jgi:hypothetical protein
VIKKTCFGLMLKILAFVSCNGLWIGENLNEIKTDNGIGAGYD